MNRIILSAALLAGIHLCCGSGALAQEKTATSSRIVIRDSSNYIDQQMAVIDKQIDSLRKQLIATNLTLTDTEATKFWPVYDQYSAELKKITETKSALVKEYADAYPSLTDEQADSLIRRWLDSDIAVFELRKKYLPIFRKVLDGKITATFFQLEHRISAMIDLQLTSQLPLMQGEDQSLGVQ